MSGFKILIAEDDPDISAIYALSLRQSGYQVTIAHSGNEALKQMRQSLPDVILLDIMMPDLDGLKMLEKARTEFNTVMFPLVIVMTNLDRPDLKEQAKKLGASGYVVKANIAPHDIPEIIQQAIQRLKEKSL